MPSEKLLDLSGADTSGFDPLEAGRYNAEVFEISVDAVKNPGGKTPVGTPMIKVQFKLTGNEHIGDGLENRRVWTQYVVPPKDYDESKASKMKGMIARFFMALGDSEETVRSKNFNPDFEDYTGRPCVVVVGKEQKRTREGEIIQGEYNNPVKGVKPAGSIGEGVATGLL
jgi:hypothetical protein